MAMRRTTKLGVAGAVLLTALAIGAGAMRAREVRTHETASRASQIEIAEWDLARAWQIYRLTGHDSDLVQIRRLKHRLRELDRSREASAVSSLSVERFIRECERGPVEMAGLASTRDASLLPSVRLASNELQMMPVSRPMAGGLASDLALGRGPDSAGIVGE